jgi:hypothetical protein
MMVTNQIRDRIAEPAAVSIVRLVGRLQAAGERLSEAVQLLEETAEIADEQSAGGAEHRYLVRVRYAALSAQRHLLLGAEFVGKCAALTAPVRQWTAAAGPGVTGGAGPVPAAASVLTKAWPAVESDRPNDAPAIGTYSWTGRLRQTLAPPVRSRRRLGYSSYLNVGSAIFTGLGTITIWVPWLIVRCVGVAAMALGAVGSTLMYRRSRRRRVWEHS